MQTTLNFACDCGKMQGRIDRVTPQKIGHLTCYCKYCLGFPTHLGTGDKYIRDGGWVNLVQVAPDDVTIDQGSEHLACLKFTPKGPLRWYASCCGTPIANTLAGRMPPFASFYADTMGDADLGPVQLHSFCDHLPAAQRPQPSGNKAVRAFVLRFAKRVIPAILTLRFRKNPFFDAKGAPVATPQLLSKEQAQAAFPAR
ncbi:hypothetical protein ACMU_14170 [Actibacterium mucosum KCTC 23349]|uniref:CENP-V/GFA domain-containing protein n=1 Tax=Actibacterium mucosum KCTC 23349 TaxID=1454373 RepID=A0A037ZJE7_9RHOB|nr:DUF6151 family protein [Actibacterium mucosum]KAJ54906.1 hypothetical protein ACMU_14170 [Actibacterium mucosum KCTC 23349]